MKELEKQLKALANTRRLSILRNLKQKELLSVSALAGLLHLSIRSTSRHLGVLRAAGIVRFEQRDLLVFYFLSSEMSPPAKFILSQL
ncbi:MAG: helix-turn-helix transcriptional regulator [Candidatus Doudnabacteria bacterium]|nr:helix-turn-helix transcriptional regulator [Candidatus Doudnabacteria bacterium]